MICRNCGAENRESASFGRKCGTKLTSEEEVIKVGEDTASDITEKDTGDEVITIGAQVLRMIFRKRTEQAAVPETGEGMVSIVADAGAET
ncbi:MAG: zinc ribbon domain-containing protein [Anaerovoracaceae bacterium]